LNFPFGQLEIEVQNVNAWESKCVRVQIMNVHIHMWAFQKFPN